MMPALPLAEFICYRNKKLINMKKTMFSIMAVLSFSLAFAQTKSGIATFTTPSGWRISQESPAIVLEYAARKGDTCQITILKTESIAVINKETFIKARLSRSRQGITYSKDADAVTMTETNGIVSFSSRSIADPARPDQRYYLYSFTNKQATFFVQLYCNNINTCKESMNTFLASLLVDSVTTDEPAANANKAKQDATKTKRSRKAAPAAPAAPAPMM